MTGATPATTPRKPRSRLRKWAIGIGILLVLCVLLLTALSITIRHALDQRIQAQLALYRQAGIPTTHAECEALFPAPPEKENAATYYREAGRLMNLSGLSPELHEAFPISQSVPSENLWDESEAAEDVWLEAGLFLEKNREALDTLRRAAKFTQCRHLTEWSFESRNRFDSLNNAAWLLTLDTAYQVKQDNLPDAINSLVALAGLPRSLLNEPLTYSQHDRDGFLERTSDMLQWLLNQSSLAAAQLAQLDQALRELSTSNRHELHDIMATHLFLWHKEFRHPIKTGEIVWQQIGPSGRSILSEIPGGHGLLAHFYEYSGWDALNRLAFLESNWDNIQQYMPSYDPIQNTPQPQPLTAHLPRYLVPTRDHAWWYCSRFHQRMHDARIHMNAAHAAIAVERYRLANGQLPDTLDVLVPDFLESVPADRNLMGEEKPLLLEITDAGYQIREEWNEEAIWFSVGR